MFTHFTSPPTSLSSTMISRSRLLADSLLPSSMRWAPGRAAGYSLRRTAVRLSKSSAIVDDFHAFRPRRELCTLQVASGTPVDELIVQRQAAWLDAVQRNDMETASRLVSQLSAASTRLAPQPFSQALTVCIRRGDGRATATVLYWISRIAPSQRSQELFLDVAQAFGTIVTASNDATVLWEFLHSSTRYHMAVYTSTTLRAILSGIGRHTGCGNLAVELLVHFTKHGCETEHRLIEDCLALLAAEERPAEAVLRALHELPEVGIPLDAVRLLPLLAAVARTGDASTAVLVVEAITADASTTRNHARLASAHMAVAYARKGNAREAMQVLQVAGLFSPASEPSTETCTKAAAPSDTAADTDAPGSADAPRSCPPTSATVDLPVWASSIVAAAVYPVDPLTAQQLLSIALQACVPQMAAVCVGPYARELGESLEALTHAGIQGSAPGSSGRTANHSGANAATAAFISETANRLLQRLHTANALPAPTTRTPTSHARVTIGTPPSNTGNRHVAAANGTTFRRPLHRSDPPRSDTPFARGPRPPHVTHSHASSTDSTYTHRQGSAEGSRTSKHQPSSSSGNYAMGGAPLNGRSDAQPRAPYKHTPTRRPMHEDRRGDRPARNGLGLDASTRVRGPLDVRVEAAL